MMRVTIQSTRFGLRLVYYDLFGNVWVEYRDNLDVRYSAGTIFPGGPGPRQPSKPWAPQMGGGHAAHRVGGKVASRVR